jgi:hypothetical protein
VYGWIWRHLPGGLPGRLLGSVVLLAAAVWLLFFVVFPRVEPLLPYSDVTVETTPSPTAGGAAHP